MTDVLPGQLASGAKPEAPARLWLRYFDEIVEVEHAAIDARRALNGRDPIRNLAPPSSGEISVDGRRPVSPSDDDPAVPDIGSLAFTPGKPADPQATPKDPRLGGNGPLNRLRARPAPIPRNVTGLALSGGGIRSAAVCLGALQAMHTHAAIRSIDYLSTVSGGGYIGSCLTAAMTTSGKFPFERRNDPRDMPAVGHLRNYSNYLMPRGRVPIFNLANVVVIVLRGLLANAVLVLAAILLLTLFTILLYPDDTALATTGAAAQLVYRVLMLRWPVAAEAWSSWQFPFLPTAAVAVVLCAILLYWAFHRSWITPELGQPQAQGATRTEQEQHIQGKLGDAGSRLLALSTGFFIAVLCFAVSDAIPLMITSLGDFYVNEQRSLSSIVGFLTAVVTAVGFVSDKLGQFLKTTQHSSALRTVLLRVLTRAFIILAGLALPLLLLLLYLHIAAWGIEGGDMAQVWRPFDGTVDDYRRVYGFLTVVLVAVGIRFRPNAYSLHRFYRDRLSRAFLFDPARMTPKRFEPVPLYALKLSDVDTTRSPYQIVNAALNIQGSLAANRRGRNADFFIFTPDFVGSDLTMFAATKERQYQGYANIEDMERIDPMLDLGTAMAISGAAVSANMGSSTVRPLSPTLALLNVRLGYWLRNPRGLIEEPEPATGWRRYADIAVAAGAAGLSGRLSNQVTDRWNDFIAKFYLVLEMTNQLTEHSKNVYLSDGGHIENLGIYELLKRGCELVVAVDAEADPSMSFGSLIKLQRYARIDLGIRIDLPWQQIAAMTASGAPGNGPHCAVGRILYPEGQTGILLYFKSSVSGDEPDYVLDYRKRNAAFPHETTSDQFFSEDQFEAYRALGYHMVDRFFRRTDYFAWEPESWPPGTTMDQAFEQVMRLARQTAE